MFVCLHEYVLRKGAWEGARLLGSRLGPFIGYIQGMVKFNIWGMEALNIVGKQLYIFLVTIELNP